MAKPRICVVGSCNLDMNSYVPRFPLAGETLHGHRFQTGYGGKGANQAVMAARLGAAVTMVGKVGDDIFGRDMVANLQATGVNTRYVTITAEASSGVAVITIDDEGSNMIVVISGANALLQPADVEEARSAIEAAHVLVCQMEVPMETNLAALRIARAAGVMTIFNPAPATAELPAEVYQLSDIFCPNELEAALLAGHPVETQVQASHAAHLILERGAGRVIMTMGERGSLLVTSGSMLHIATPTVKAVDTTGAGDSFVGSLAVLLGSGLGITDAMSRANQIAAISVQAPGTQASYPPAENLPPGLLPHE